MIDYLFFKFYRLWKYSSYSEIAVYAALLILAVFLNCNIHTIWGVLEQYKILPYPTRTMYNVSLGLIFILLCIRFCWKRRYKAVIEKFNEKPNKNNLLILITGMKLRCTQQNREKRETSGNNTTTYERATKFRREIQMCICLNFVLIPAAVG